MTQSKRVVCKTLQHDLGMEEFAEIMPLADLHIGDASMDKKLLRKVAEWLNAKPNRYTVIAGDIFNAALTSSVSDTYTEVLTMQQAIDAFKDFVELVGKEKILAVVRGNHDNRVVRAVGLDPVAVACELAGVPYSGAEAFVNLKIGSWHNMAGTNKKNRKAINYMLFMTHGVGGGRSNGGKVNAMLRHNQIISADIVVQGHTHTPMIVPSAVYEPDNRMENIIERDQIFVTTCGFVGREGYAQDFCYAPISQKFPIIRIGGTRRHLEAELKEFR
jgi:predicted phosphodiesterase